MTESIKIHGLTPFDDFPKCNPKFFNQFSETDILKLPCRKPSIECLLEVMVDICIESHKIICTPVGKKLVINGIKKIKVIYVADEPCQVVHCHYFEIPFCTFILLGKSTLKIIDVFSGIEYISIRSVNCREILISLIIFVCPVFKEPHPHPCKPSENICINYNHCDIHHVENKNCEWNQDYYCKPTKKSYVSNTDWDKKVNCCGGYNLIKQENCIYDTRNNNRPHNKRTVDRGHPNYDNNNDYDYPDKYIGKNKYELYDSYHKDKEL